MGTSKLSIYKEKMDNAESIIETNLDKKLDIIININNIVKNDTDKKDYLKEYISIKDLIIHDIEKDFKLEEATKLIDDLERDFNKLATDKEYIKKRHELREIDEILVSAKNLFNQNAIESNKIIKSFPYSIVAKVAGFHIKTLYSNKTEDESF